MSGDRFVLSEEDGRWFWELWGEHHPTGPIARCRQLGYKTEKGARDSMQSAYTSMKDAIEDGHLRIDRDPSYRPS